MTGKNLTISVRLSEADAKFLDRVVIGDANNQSEKLRAIIDRTRQQEEGRHNYPAGLRMADDMLDPVRWTILNQERRESIHSELLSRVYEWLPDILAYVLANVEQEPDSDEQITLQELESGVADRIFRLIEATLRLGLSSENPCYDKEAVTRRLGPALELLELMQIKRGNK